MFLTTVYKYHYIKILLLPIIKLFENEKKKKIKYKIIILKKKKLNAYVCANEKAFMPRQYNRDKRKKINFISILLQLSRMIIMGGKYKRSTTPFTNIIILVELSLF